MNVLRMVNLGCGACYHPDWINIDLAPRGPGVIAHDVSKGIPLESESCDVVYHSAVLEHMRRCDALRFIRECHRVLKCGGILRVAVPDLERICRLYLEKLEHAQSGAADTAADDYDWVLLEMYDQTVREASGGEMLAYLRQPRIDNEPFVYERIGEEGRAIVRGLRAAAGPTATAAASCPRNGDRSWHRRVRRLPGRVKSKLLSLLLGPHGRRALEIGRFRLGGEVHQWMYDGYSLARLLLAAGFAHPIRQSAHSSLIPHWSGFELDVLHDGRVRKPDSLFMEGLKPAQPPETRDSGDAS